MLVFKLNIQLQKCVQIETYYAQLYLLTHGELPFTQKDILFNGHVIEARINAENPEKIFTYSRKS